MFKVNIGYKLVLKMSNSICQNSVIISVRIVFLSNEAPPFLATYKHLKKTFGCYVLFDIIAPLLVVEQSVL
ncbi:MAG: hypothetical protein QM541_06470 [Flavobacterium sp.]|nr:hypothetical protein [Flavobacterium sp.]